jgi:hypothetical protein
VAGLRINQRFQNLLTPLSEEERASLEEMILQDGVQDPIIVWEGQIADGHNRYEIANRLNIGYEIEELQRETEDEVCAWIMKRQLGRRNVDGLSRAMIVGALARASDRKKGEDRWSKIREETGVDVSDRQLRRDVEVFEDIESLPASVRQKISSGKVKATAASIKRLKDLPEEAMSRVTDLIENAPDGGVIDSVDTAITAVEQYGKVRKKPVSIEKDETFVEKTLARMSRVLDDRASHYGDEVLGHKELCQAALTELHRRWSNWLREYRV